MRVSAASIAIRVQMEECRLIVSSNLLDGSNSDTEIAEDLLLPPLDQGVHSAAFGKDRVDLRGKPTSCSCLRST